MSPTQNWYSSVTLIPRSPSIPRGQPDEQSRPSSSSAKRASTLPASPRAPANPPRRKGRKRRIAASRWCSLRKGRRTEGDSLSGKRRGSHKSQNLQWALRDSFEEPIFLWKKKRRMAPKPKAPFHFGTHCLARAHKFPGLILHLNIQFRYILSHGGKSQFPEMEIRMLGK